MEQSIMRVLCPRCRGCMLEFEESDKAVVCHCCDQSIPMAELLRPAVAEETAAEVKQAEGSTDATLALLASIDSPESGLVYLENFYANYNWEAYKSISTILISDIEVMVDKNKIKQGASPYAWLLDFQSVSIPLAKKLEGRGELEQKMAEMFNDKDNSALMPYFDQYKNMTHALVTKRGALLKRLNNALSFAKKQGLEEDKLALMSESLASLTALLEAVALPTKLSDLPAVREAQEAINAKKREEYREQGIDAEDIYNQATAIFHSTARDKSLALSMFESIRGYADSLEYIDKINTYFGYDGKFYHFFNRDYVYKAKEPTLFDPATVGKDAKKKKKKNVEEDEETLEEKSYEGKTYQLFEVVDKEPAEEPILKNITQIITFYGTKLFYVKLGKTICSFDMITLTETELCIGNKGDIKVFNDNGTIYTNPSRTSIFVRKRLELEINAVGCVKKFFGKKDKVVERKNNYSVLEINLSENTCKPVLDSIVDITEQRDEYLFYTVADEAEETGEKACLMALNTETYEKKQVLSQNCEINAVVGSKVVYTLYSPNVYNMDLHVYDIRTDTDTVIETNIYDFFRVIGDRVYYYVGNYAYRPLFSNNLEGTDRVEIMTNVENIIAVHAGWMYILKGTTRNAVLIKVSVDGKKRLVVCSQFKTVVKITDSDIYYIDTSDVLRVVRTDGKFNTVIADDIDAANVVVDLDRIYYLRWERVNNKKKSYLSRSLYTMDLHGHNVRKVMFNVLSIKNYDENMLYIERGDQLRYHIFYPAKRKKNERSEIKTFHFTRYYKFDKASGAMDNFLNIDFPHPSKYPSRGCVGKPVEMESKFTEIPIKPDYERKGAEEGSVQNEQIAEKMAEEMAKKSGGCGNGCLGRK